MLVNVGMYRRARNQAMKAYDWNRVPYYGGVKYESEELDTVVWAEYPTDRFEPSANEIHTWHVDGPDYEDVAGSFNEAMRLAEADDKEWVDR